MDPYILLFIIFMLTSIISIILIGLGFWYQDDKSLKNSKYDNSPQPRYNPQEAVYDLYNVPRSCSPLTYSDPAERPLVLPYELFKYPQMMYH